MSLRWWSRGRVRVRSRLWPRLNVRLAPKCQKCGYSLVGLAGQGVSKCPECGQELGPPDFAGLYRVHGRTVWLVLACGPAIVVFVPLFAFVRAETWTLGVSTETRMIVAIFTLLAMAVGSAALTLAMAGTASEGKPLLIRGTNWQGAMSSIALLGVLLVVLLIAITSGVPGRP